ncbi:hypothetical protein AVM02_06745 [Brucella anthropi]|uniref:hypothetical protein n=1 Tax=Brucella anthropi TaxID=529 RepID=UPI0039860EE2
MLQAGKVGSVQAVLWAGGLGSDVPEPNRLRQRVDAEAIIRLECEADKAKMWPAITIANRHSLFVITNIKPASLFVGGFSGWKPRLKSGIHSLPLKLFHKSITLLSCTGSVRGIVDGEYRYGRALFVFAPVRLGLRSAKG